MKYKKMLAVVLTTSIAASAVPMTAWAEDETEGVTTAEAEVPKEESVESAGESDTESVELSAETGNQQENAETAENTDEQQKAEAETVVKDAEGLQKALDAAKEGDTIKLSGSFEVDGASPIKITKKVVLNGGSYTITATGNWNETGFKNVITVTAEGVEIQNLKLDCGKCEVSGIHVYNCEDVKLNDVEITNFPRAGVIVNSAEVTATDLVVKGAEDCWGSVNVDDNAEGQPKFTFESGTLKDAVQIYDEAGNATEPVVVAEGMEAVTIDKETGKKFYTDNIENLAAAKGGIYNANQKVIYDNLATAVEKAVEKDIIRLYADITLKDGTKGNAQGIVTIANKTLTIDGNGHNITVAQDEGNAQKASAFNIEGGADVTFENVKLDAKGTAKHGFNVFTGKATIKGGEVTGFTGYAVVCNGADVTIDGLKTSNNGWGGINVDATNSANKGSKITIIDANIADTNAVYFEQNGSNENNKVTGKIEGGTFEGKVHIADAAKDAATLQVAGGTFSNSVAEYSDKKVELNSNGKYTYYETVKKAQEHANPGDTIKDTNNPDAEALKQVQVTWKPNGGTLLGDCEETEMYSAGDTVKVPDVSRSRYRLRGWTDEAGQYVDFSKYTLGKEKDTVTFTAQWKKKSSSSGGSSSSSSSDKEYSIAIDQDIENGKVKVDPSKAEKGDKVTITVTPDKGYEIDKVTVKDADGDKLELKEKGKGEYTFTMPDSKVEVKATFVKAEEKPETPAEAKTIILTIDQKIANVFGEYVVNDVAPIIRNERTMLPIRFIAQNLGAEVAWDDALNKVTITKDDLKIELYINSAVAVVNGENVTLDAPAFIENSRTYLPLRFVAENLGATVTWDAAARQVTIQK